MLIAMAITLLMMAAVVTVFANVSDSIRNRRAAIDVSSQMGHVREVLQRDLAAATCPALPPQRPESNQGYLEFMEGPRADFDPSLWLRDDNNDGRPDDLDGPSDPLPSLDLSESTLPTSPELTLPGATTRVTDNSSASANGNPSAVTDGRGLGDADDTLAFTARNEDEPYVGRIPEPFNDANNNDVQDAGEADLAFPVWRRQNLESQLAEIVWFAVENPIDPNRTFYFGEPGYRTIYRRTLLIAPQLNYAFNIGGQVTGPGVVRVLSNAIGRFDTGPAIASLIAFQERYDLSVRLEWDPLLDPGNGGRWKIVANSLADLTKRENRYEHHGFRQPGAARRFPFAAVSLGAGYSDGDDLQFVQDPELTQANPITTAAQGEVHFHQGHQTFSLDERGAGYSTRPFVYLDRGNLSNPATVRAIVNEDNQIVAVTTGYTPLGGARRGEDIMLTDVLAFDMRVYDPDAPLLAEIPNNADPNFPGNAVEPGDAGWGAVANRDFNDASRNNQPTVVGRGAYVDLGYWFRHYSFGRATAITTDDLPDLINPPTSFDPAQVTDLLLNDSVFALNPQPRSRFLPFNSTAFTPYRAYDTWSFHYENNGLNEDEVNPPILIDEGADGVDNDGLLGPDDPGEYETAPPYNAPLRGVQVTLRAYERDSRQVREVKVRQTFVPQ